MSRPVWLDAAINPPWSRDPQPAIPVTAEEIVAEAPDALNRHSSA